MKNLKHAFLIILSVSFIFILYSCATTKAEPEQKVTSTTPPANLPKLVNESELSLVPKQTKYEQIYVKLFLPERPEENLVTIYIYDKTKKKYVCCIENCYFDTIQEESFTGLGVLWSSWAKQNAYYLIDIDRYDLLDENGNKY